MSDDRMVKPVESLTITFREAVVLTGLSRNTLYKRVRQYDVDLASVRAEKGRSA